MTRWAMRVAAIALAVAPTMAGAQQTYTLIDPSVGSAYDGVTLNGINNSGDFAGYGVVTATGEIHAVLYHGGAFQDLGLLGFSASAGIAINATDQLAVDGIGPGSTALFYDGVRARRIGSIDGGYTYSRGMNNHGDVVGYANNGDGALVGFSWVNGTFNDLSLLYILRGAAINDADQIVGSSGYYWSYGGYVHSSLHGFLYSGGVFTDLGSLSGDPRTNTEALAINGAGQIVGYSAASDGLQHAFLYSGGAMQDLGTLGGANAAAVAINAGGLIAGNLTNPYGANLGAFVYANGTMTDLSSLIVGGGDGWSQLVVSGMNDAGVIVGNGTYNGGSRGFLAYPAQALSVGGTAVGLRSAISNSRPNPFRSTTTIPFAVSERAATGAVRLDIFDVTGRRIATLLDREETPGAHTVVWDGRGDGGVAMKSGLYFAHLTTRDGSAVRRIALER